MSQRSVGMAEKMGLWNRLGPVTKIVLVQSLTVRIRPPSAPIGAGV